MPYFQLVPSYSLPPGVCYLCKASQRFAGEVGERIVDTGLDIIYEGRLCICEACLGEMARLVGCWSDPEERERAAAQVAAATAQVDQMLAEVESVRAERDEFCARVLRKLGQVDELMDMAVEVATSADASDEAKSEARRGPGRPRKPRDEHGEIIR